MDILSNLEYAIQHEALGFQSLPTRRIAPNRNPFPSADDRSEARYGGFR